MPEYWLTSDTHAYHANIVRGTSKWTHEGGKPHLRDFDNEVLMTEEMAGRFNALIEPNDVLYHIGDWSFGGKDKIKLFRDMINCRNIHLIYGNHDNNIRKSDEYRGLFTSFNEILNTKICGVQCTLCHYNMRLWFCSNKGALHFFGHSHGNLIERTPRSKDVGVDTFDLWPYRAEIVIKKLQEEPIAIYDHHTEKSNPV